MTGVEPPVGGGDGRKAVVLPSGGLDSATPPALALCQGFAENGSDPLVFGRGGVVA